MSDDFCLIHGYEHMKSQFGNPIPYCEACENERGLIPAAENQAQTGCHCGKDGHALGSVNCPVHGYEIVPKRTTLIFCTPNDKHEGPCDMSGWADIVEPTTGRISGGSAFCTKCGMMALNNSIWD